MEEGNTPSNHGLDRRSGADGFFAIAKDRLEAAQTRLHGYAITDRAFFHNCEVSDAEAATITGSTSGAFTLVHVEDDTITLRNDSTGTFALFLYRNGDDWVIGNSLFAVLDALDGRDVELNFDYVANYFCEHFATFTRHATLAEQITILPRGTTVRISRTDATLTIRQAQRPNYRSIPLDSVDALHVIDTWISRYTGILKRLAIDGKSIGCDVTGGFDSRITLSLVLASGIDFSNVRFHSDNTKPVYADDYAVAGLLAEEIGFELNANPAKRTFVRLPLATVRDLYRNTKLAYHRNPFVTQNFCGTPGFTFGGEGGEAQRGLWYQSPDSYLQRIHYARHRGFLVDYSVRALAEEFGPPEYAGEANLKAREAMMQEQYNTGRCRAHFGTDIVRSSMMNNVRFAPLLDPLLFTIDPTLGGTADSLLLYAVIMERIDPRLLDIRFENKRAIPPEVIRQAKEISKQLPPPNYENEAGFQYRSRLVIHDDTMATDAPKEDFNAHTQTLIALPHVEAMLRHVVGDAAYEKSYPRPDAPDHYQPRAARVALWGIAEAILAVLKSKGAVPQDAVIDDAMDMDALRAGLATIPSAASRDTPAEISKTAIEVANMLPDMLSPKLRLARILLEEGKAEKAILVLEKICQTAPQSALAFSELGEAYISLKQWGDAIGALEKSLELDPNNGVARVRLTNLLQQMRRFDEAKATIEEGLNRDPMSPTFQKKHTALMSVIEAQKATAEQNKA